MYSLKWGGGSCQLWCIENIINASRIPYGPRLGKGGHQLLLGNTPNHYAKFDFFMLNDKGNTSISDILIL